MKSQRSCFIFESTGASYVTSNTEGLYLTDDGLQQLLLVC